MLCMSTEVYFNPDFPVNQKELPDAVPGRLHPPPPDRSCVACLSHNWVNVSRKPLFTNVLIFACRATYISMRQIVERQDGYSIDFSMIDLGMTLVIDKLISVWQ